MSQSLVAQIIALCCKNDAFLINRSYNIFNKTTQLFVDSEVF